MGRRFFTEEISIFHACENIEKSHTKKLIYFRENKKKKRKKKKRINKCEKRKKKISPHIKCKLKSESGKIQ